MAGLGGFQGLTANTGKRQAATNDLAYMEKMVSMKKQGEAEEQQAEAAYADVLANVKSQANSLLENDRVAVNDYSNKLISEMKARLKAVGGSKTAFMKAGGMSELANYRASVLGSEAFTTGQNNNAYMQRLLMLKEQGKGHLINERDLTAMQNYNANGGGKLSYTGVLNEIEIDPKAYEYGKVLSPQDVLDAGNNRFAIMANYEADTGLQYNPNDGDKDLLAYIRYKGYGGVGTNTAITKARIAQAASDKKKNAVATPSVATTITQAMGSGVKDYKDMTFEGGYGASKNNTGLLGAKADTQISVTDRALLGLRDPERYQVKGGAQIASGKEREVAMSYYGLDTANEDGTITINPLNTNGTYDGKGSALTGKFKWGTWDGNYKPMGITMGYKGKDKDGNSMLIMEAVNKDGTPDTKKNAELYGDENPNGEPTLMIRMHDPENPSYDWFQEVPADSAIHSHMLGQNFGDDNKIDDTLKEQQELQTQLDKANIIAESQIRESNKQAKAINDKIETGVDMAMKHADKSETLESPYFKLLISQHNSGAVKRDVLIQSYYQAASQGREDQLIAQADGKAFNLALEDFGLGDFLSKNDMSDDQFIQKYYEEDLKAADTGKKQNTYTFAKTWKAIYDKNMNPTK